MDLRNVAIASNANGKSLALSAVFRIRRYCTRASLIFLVFLDRAWFDLAIAGRAPRVRHRHHLVGELAGAVVAVVCDGEHAELPECVAGANIVGSHDLIYPISCGQADALAGSFSVGRLGLEVVDAAGWCLR